MKKERHRIFKIPGVRYQILQIFFFAAILPILILGIFAIIHVRN